jgi:hypothetical protein
LPEANILDWTSPDSETPWTLRIGLDSKAKLIEQIDQEFLPAVLDGLQTAVVIPRNMTIEFRSCEYPNAFWDPDENRMTIFHVLIKMLYDLAEDLEIPR